MRIRASDPSIWLIILGGCLARPPLVQENTPDSGGGSIAQRDGGAAPTGGGDIIRGHDGGPACATPCGRATLPLECDVGVNLLVPRVSLPPVMDGVLQAGEWPARGQRDLVFGQGLAVTSNRVTLAHDGVNLYVGSTSHAAANPSAKFRLLFDGNHSCTLDGQAAQPHHDLQLEMPAPSGDGWYRLAFFLTGQTGQVAIPNEPKASNGVDGAFTYEFQIALAELGAGSGSLVGILLDDSWGGDASLDRWYPPNPVDVPAGGEALVWRHPDHWATLLIE